MQRRASNVDNAANLAQLLLFAEPGNDTHLYYFNDHKINRVQIRRAVMVLASQLGQLLNPGDRIVICLNDSPSLVSIFLAAMAVGAVPTVINPKCREQNLLSIMDDCLARVLVVGTESHLKLPAMPGVTVLCKPDDEQQVFSDFKLNTLVGEGDPGWSNFVQTERSQTCYLQYTSGSTGKPKGVIHTVDTTMGFCRAFAQNNLVLQESDLCYSVPKIFFGYGMGNSLFFPLMTGAAAVLDERWPTPENIIENILRYQPNVLFAVPAVYQMLHDKKDNISGNIRLAVSAGSPLPQDEFEFWSDAGLEVCDGIGATEVGHIFLANQPGQAKAGRTGKPLSEYECVLLDTSGTVITEPNRQGVLLVKGPGVSPGYFGLADKTTERFTDGWYRTGDMFSCDGQGHYRYLGREDDLFKVNGRWVVPTLLEQRVCCHFDAIAEAVLTPSSRERDNVRSTLFIVPNKDIPVDNKALKSWLKNEFESHMQPREIVLLAQIPRNDNGKIMRSVLVNNACELLKRETESPALCD